MNIKLKLQLAFGTILIILLIISGIGMYYINDNNKMIATIEKEQKTMALYNEIAFQTVRANAAIRGFMSYHEDYMQKNHYEIREQLHSAIDQLQASNEKSEEFDSFLTKLAAWEAGIDENIMPLITKGQHEDALIVGKPILGEGSTELVQFGKKMANEVNIKIEKNLSLSKKEGKSSLIKLAVLAVISIIISFLLATIFGRRISNTINEVVKKMNEFAKGNFHAQLSLKTKDEFGHLASSFNTMTADLRLAVKQVGDSSEQVAATAEQLTASSNEVSKATEEITDSIQEISSGIEDQNVMTKHVNDLSAKVLQNMNEISANIQTVNSTALTTKKLTDHGQQSIENVKDQMEMIAQKTDSLTEQMKILDNNSNTIVQAVSVIKDIAAQTNLLAINASIEAARSGEHGKGFAVVATEVRKLADESNKAAVEIEKIVTAITENTGRIVEEIMDNDRTVEVGKERVDLASAAFSNIDQSINEVQLQTNAVTSAIQHIYSDIESLVRDIEQINDISFQSNGNAQNVAASSEEQNAAMEEVAAASTHLAQMAIELQETIRSFRY